jgi:hypothetical protein
MLVFPTVIVHFFSWTHFPLFHVVNKFKNAEKYDVGRVGEIPSFILGNSCPFIAFLIMTL